MDCIICYSVVGTNQMLKYDKLLKKYFIHDLLKNYFCSECFFEINEELVILEEKLVTRLRKIKFRLRNDWMNDEDLRQFSFEGRFLRKDILKFIKNIIDESGKEINFNYYCTKCKKKHNYKTNSDHFIYYMDK